MAAISKAVAAVLISLLLALFQGLGCALSSRSTPKETALWSSGVPRVLDWGDYGLAVGTGAGHLLVYDDRGGLKWERRVNFTSVWGVSWSSNGELAAVSLGPPGAVYVFASTGALLWSVEFEYSQAYAVAWSGDLLAVGGGDLLVFDRGGKLLWSKNGTAIDLSWYRDSLAAAMCLGGPQCTWGIYVFSKSGDLLWSFEGVFNRISWSGNGYLAALGGYDRVVYVFDSWGRVKWWRYLNESVAGSLTWFSNLLAVGDGSGVTVFDEGGEVVWRYKTGGYYVEAVSPYGDAYLGVGSQSGNFTLLDAGGNELWSYWTCGYVWSIKWRGDLVAIASSDGYVHVLNKNGNLLWKKKVGFLVRAVALHHGLVAAGGWDLNTVVVDIGGDVKWSSETGWVYHLAWYEDLLAVGGYGKLFVFDVKGNLKWSFDFGSKVRSLSWGNNGLLAVGGNDRLGVFTKNGTLLWGYLTSNWVLSLSWSGPLLAAGIASEGVYVLDERGNLKWFFKSVRENATIPWWVSASWWGDVLVVVTDYTYALDRHGDLLWFKEEVYGTTIAPGKNFVAFGGGRGVYVLDESGEVEWYYTSPERLVPREYYSKLYPDHVLALDWVGEYLVAGDRLGRVFLFNETGDLLWVYNTGFSVYSLSVEESTFAAGGEGGLLVKELLKAPESPRRMLAELPAPYDRFDKVFTNKTLLYMSGTATLTPPQYVYSPGFTVSSGVAYAFFEARLNSSTPVELALMTKEEFEDFTKAGSGSGNPKLSWTGKEIYVRVPLTFGTYFVVLIPIEQTEVSYSIQAYESSLPPFKERRVYLPMGVSDYGIAYLPEGVIGYSYDYTEAWGIAEVWDLYAARPFGDEGVKHWVTLQLNAFLHLQTESGRQVYWVQNIAVLDTERRQLRAVNNLWNTTTYPTSVLSKQLVKGGGVVAREARMGDYYFYAAESWANYSYPLSIVLYLSARTEDGAVKLEFGRSTAGRPIEIYDTVYLNVSSKLARFRVDPATAPVSNVEFVLAGPSGAKPKTSVEKINASLRLFVNFGGNLVPIPTAYSHGYSTHERVKGVSVSYCGSYSACLSAGKAVPSQVYYSLNSLPSMQLLWIRDPLGIFTGLKVIEVGSDVGLPVGYLIDLGNTTRAVLKGYEYVSKNEVELKWGRQYYVSVYSEYGEVEGGGWYSEGEEVRISVSPVKVERDSKIYTFQGWERNGALVSTSPTYVFSVQAPTLLKARWVAEESATTRTANAVTESITGITTGVRESEATTHIGPVTKADTILVLVLASTATIALASILLHRKSGRSSTSRLRKQEVAEQA